MSEASGTGLLSHVLSSTIRGNGYLHWWPQVLGDETKQMKHLTHHLAASENRGSFVCPYNKSPLFGVHIIRAPDFWKLPHHTASEHVCSLDTKLGSVTSV